MQMDTYINVGKLFMNKTGKGIKNVKTKFICLVHLGQWKKNPKKWGEDERDRIYSFQFIYIYNKWKWLLQFIGVLHEMQTQRDIIERIPDRW